MAGSVTDFWSGSFTEMRNSPNWSGAMPPPGAAVQVTDRTVPAAASRSSVAVQPGITSRRGGRHVWQGDAQLRCERACFGFVGYLEGQYGRSCPVRRRRRPRERAPTQGRHRIAVRRWPGQPRRGRAGRPMGGTHAVVSLCVSGFGSVSWRGGPADPDVRPTLRAAGGVKRLVAACECRVPARDPTGTRWGRWPRARHATTPRRAVPLPR